MIVTVDTHLRVPGSSLTGTQISLLESALTMDNVAKVRAKREHVRKWDELPDTITLWDIQDDGTFVLPRGIAHRLVEIVPDVEFDDQRRRVPIDTSTWKIPVLRDYQEAAVEKLCGAEQGVYEAPAASGKTVSLLELVRRVKQRSVIVVSSAHIAEQWKQRALEHLGIRTGLVGDGRWEEEDLTIAIQQTLWSRADDLVGWWGQWGLAAYDECHHIPAETFYETAQRFPSLYRLGVSATPDKQVGYQKMVTAALGPTVHSTDRATLVQRGFIVDPVVELRQTGFDFGFYPTHRRTKNKDTGLWSCPFKACPHKTCGVPHRNNYTNLVAALVDDPGRNDVIATDIAREVRAGRSILVLSMRLRHLDNLARRTNAILGTDEYCWRLSGKEKTHDRMDVYERAAEGQVAIFSTIGEEAMDIPRLDALCLAFPGRNIGGLEQKIGRVGRTHGDKLQPKLLDYIDNSGVLYAQLQERTAFYRALGLQVLTM